MYLLTRRTCEMLFYFIFAFLSIQIDTANMSSGTYGDVQKLRLALDLSKILSTATTKVYVTIKFSQQVQALTVVQYLVESDQ